jgi:hypothetical protein
MVPACPGAAMKPRSKIRIELVLLQDPHTVLASPDGDVIRPPGKGRNFPDGELALPSLTDKDSVELDFDFNESDLVDYPVQHDVAGMGRHSEVLLPEFIIQATT